MERIVSRVDLLSPAGTPEPEELSDLTAQVRPQKFKFVTKTSETDNFAFAKDNEDLLDFRLFAPTSATESANKIRLRSPTPHTTAPGFVAHERNLNYYLAELSSSADKSSRNRSATGVNDMVTGPTSATKRKQPGKKARIQIRVKLAAQRAETDKQQTDAKAREIADREKRIRLNRAKTLRKRAREKARKAGVEKDGSDGEGD
ncbi:hypothetical protein LTR56_008824 [Elasticomyces elasticus]|nr:hypothetical protein LTR22_021725 [Elasticomyces elasticus]KAK3645946.1 hypothetical protein LTR56_008824 [Elasticomyces elasticus]KAK4928102.1 hypothetical protein LTR49_005040 [Elasticomyces elasticus]KAK5765855.1 hypothetical protein LTS12_003862 [Elasticomyces elasticus]